MNTNEPENSIFEGIKSGKTKMRPRRYFVLQSLFQALLVVIVLALLLYVASFIIYVLRQNDAPLAIYFGLSGWLLFLQALPWASVFILIVLILILAYLMNRYSFVYHHPLFYFLFVLILLVGCASFVLAAFHRSFLSYATENGMPFLGNFYQYESAPPPGIYRGAILVFTADGFEIINEEKVTSSVIYPPGTTQDFITTLATGDMVVVFGQRDFTGTIAAFGIDKAL